MFGSPVGPPMLPTGATTATDIIVQTADNHVMIMSEMVHDAKIIRIGRAQSDAQERPSVLRQLLGSVGRRHCWRGRDHEHQPTTAYPGGPPFGGRKGDRTLHWRIDEETIRGYEFTVEDRDDVHPTLGWRDPDQGCMPRSSESPLVMKAITRSRTS